MGELPSFGAWLKRRRKALDLTQNALAQLVGCSVVSIRKFEGDEQRPSRQLAELLAQHLAIPSEERATFVQFARVGLDAAPPELPLPAGAAFPASHAPQPALPNNLPIPPTPLIGRAQDVVTVRDMLGRTDVRLLTLSGPGGIGKTRLAFAVAAALTDAFTDGVTFVDLTPIRDAALVALTIAPALGVMDATGTPLVDRLRAFLRDRRLLLLLDNFEQVVDAAPLLAALLAGCPNLKIMVTSRAPLRLSGEHEFPVPPLELPPHPPPPSLMPGRGGAELAQYAAVQLFVARAQAALPSFTLTDTNASVVAEICRRLDGLPLAIELAAARIKLFAPAALLARLRDRFALLTGGARDLPARQQTLRTTIDWSYDLLSPVEQRLFRCLAVFVGGWTLDAAAAVCEDEETRRQRADRSEGLLVSRSSGLRVYLDGLQTLVDQSLVRREDGPGGEPRFRRLETIREYALELLELSEEEQTLRRRHAQYFLALVEQAALELEGADQANWLDRLERERDNLRAVLAWSLSAQGDVEVGLRLSMTLGRWTLGFMLMFESYEWLERALPRMWGSDPPPPALRARVLYALGAMLVVLPTNPARAMTLLEESLALFQVLGDRAGMAGALDALGRAARNQGDYPRAQMLGEQSLALFQAEEDVWGIAIALMSLGDVALDQGDTTQATRRFEEALAMCHDAGSRLAGGWALINLGRIAYVQGNHARALTVFAETLALFREARNRVGVAQTLIELGRVARAQGADARAAAHFAESLVLLREWRIDQREIAYGLEGLAGAAVRGQPRRSARLFGAAAALRESAGIPLPPVQRADYERDVGAARAQVDESSFAAAWSAGRALTLEQAIAEALEPLNGGEEQ